MPRSNRPRRPGNPTGQPGRKAGPVPEIDLERARAGIPTHESAPDGEWSIRRITERNAAKDYICPGCHRVIPSGLAHLVVWQEDSLFGAAAGLAGRRHWHVNCWRTRSYKY